MRLLALGAIRLYQRYVSPRKGFSCAYRVHAGKASCSALGYRAVGRHGVFTGLGLIRERTRRCGELHREFAAKGLGGLRAQRGFCDGCDIPTCDLPSCDGFSDACSRGDACDCGGCDRWRKDKPKRNEEPFRNGPVRAKSRIKPNGERTGPPEA